MTYALGKQIEDQVVTTGELVQYSSKTLQWLSSPRLKAHLDAWERLHHYFQGSPVDPAYLRGDVAKSYLDLVDTLYLILGNPKQSKHHQEVQEVLDNLEPLMQEILSRCAELDDQSERGKLEQRVVDTFYRLDVRKVIEISQKILSASEMPNVLERLEAGASLESLYSPDAILDSAEQIHSAALKSHIDAWIDLQQLYFLNLGEISDIRCDVFSLYLLFSQTLNALLIDPEQVHLHQAAVDLREAFAHLLDSILSTSSKVFKGNEPMQPTIPNVQIPQPQSDEYGEFYSDYVARASKYPDVLVQLAAQRDELAGLVGQVSEAQAEQPPAPDEWTFKQVIGHLADAERVFGYRALRFSRKDATPLPGFDQGVFTRESNFNAQPLADLLAEWDHLRAANLLMFRAVPPDRFMQRGIASNTPITLRALLYVIVGHADQHLDSLRTVYLPVLVARS